MSDQIIELFHRRDALTRKAADLTAEAEIEDERIRERMNPILSRLPRLDPLKNPDKFYFPSFGQKSGGWESLEGYKLCPEGDHIVMTYSWQWHDEQGKDEYQIYFPMALIENPTPEAIAQFIADMNAQQVEKRQREKAQADAKATEEARKTFQDLLRQHPELAVEVKDLKPV